jgi:RND family efflux transporter MFP subunit
MLKKLALVPALLLLTQAGCQVNSEELRQVIYQPVASFTVNATQDFEVQRSFTGVVAPAQSADIAFEFAGRIESVLVSEGDRVEAGQQLAQLDTALLAIERRQLEAQLAEARANLRLTLNNLKRQTSLETDGYASRQRRDELEAGRDAVEASVNHLQAALDGNRVRQDKARLYAPFAGVVSERFLEQGSTAAPGSPVLRLLETDRLEAHIGVPRQLAGALQRGDKVALTVAGRQLSGKVLAVGAELKSHSHAVKIRIALPSTDLLAGSLVELEMAERIGLSGFVVPETALTASLRGLWRVYVLKPDAQGDLFQVEARDLQLRYTDEQQAFVLGGLNDGDRVIASGVHNVVPGQLVRLAQLDARG